jgi:Farnesoic acid 0-methyl transferase
VSQLVKLFTCAADDSFIVYTDETNAFDHIVLSTERKFFVFSVKACRSVHVILTRSPGVVDTFAYEVVIGASDNTVSAIRKLPPDEMVREYDTKDILSCETETIFWMTWSDGVIRVGGGNSIGSGELFNMNDDNPYSINALSLASRDSQQASWQFTKDSGNFC